MVVSEYHAKLSHTIIVLLECNTASILITFRKIRHAQCNFLLRTQISCHSYFIIDCLILMTLQKSCLHKVRHAITCLDNQNTS